MKRLPTSPSLMPPPSMNVIDQFDALSREKVVRALKLTSMSTAPNADNIKWPMVATIHNSIPYTLSNLYGVLLRHGLHPTSWKNAKCILIPKPSKKEKNQAKSDCPKALLSTLSKTLEKIVALRQARLAVQIGAINNNQTGSTEQLSVQDPLCRILTPAQSWLEQKKWAGKYGILQPTILENDIDGALNMVRHEHLHDLMRFSGFPTYLLNWIHHFCSHRTLCFHFDDKAETRKTFDSGLLPQGSPLSPMCVVIYSAPTIRCPPGRNKVYSIYMDDNTMLQGAARQSFAIKRLQEKLEVRVKKARPLGLQCSPAKTELIHLYPGMLAGRKSPSPHSD